MKTEVATFPEAEIIRRAQVGKRWSLRATLSAVQPDGLLPMPPDGQK